MNIYTAINDTTLEVRKVNKEPRRYATPTITVLSTWLRGNMKVAMSLS